MLRSVMRPAFTVVHRGRARAQRRGAVFLALPLIALGCAMSESAIVYLASQMALAGQAFWAVSGAF